MQSKSKLITREKMQSDMISDGCCCVLQFHKRQRCLQMKPSTGLLIEVDICRFRFGLMGGIISRKKRKVKWYGSLLNCCCDALKHGAATLTISAELPVSDFRGRSLNAAAPRCEWVLLSIRAAGCWESQAWSATVPEGRKVKKKNTLASKLTSVLSHITQQISLQQSVFEVLFKDFFFSAFMIRLCI